MNPLISVSNIAWPNALDSEIAYLLSSIGVSAIDIAPRKYFPASDTVKPSNVEAVRNWWYRRNIEVVGLQGLFFGAVGYNLFSDPDRQREMIEFIGRDFQIAELLGASKLTFGSARNRDCNGLGRELSQSEAMSFFQRVGDLALSHGVEFCLEATPECYGGSFLTTTRETEEFVKKLNHPAIRMQIDTGIIQMNQSDVALIETTERKLVGHYHISEPYLAPVGIGNQQEKHSEILKKIFEYLEPNIVTVEMKESVGIPISSAIKRSVEFVRKSFLS